MEVVFDERKSHNWYTGGRVPGRPLPRPPCHARASVGFVVGERDMEYWGRWAWNRGCLSLKAFTSPPSPIQKPTRSKKQQQQKFLLSFPGASAGLYISKPYLTYFHEKLNFGVPMPGRFHLWGYLETVTHLLLSPFLCCFSSKIPCGFPLVAKLQGIVHLNHLLLSCLCPPVDLGQSLRGPYVPALSRSAGECCMGCLVESSPPQSRTTLHLRGGFEAAQWIPHAVKNFFSASSLSYIHSFNKHLLRAHFEPGSVIRWEITEIKRPSTVFSKLPV